MTDETCPRVAVLMSCFNRRSGTLRCLQALGRQSVQQPRRVEIYLVDDGSSDGTADAVRERFPAVHLISGKGNLYWNGGMRLAFAEARKGEADYYLWLNDDTILVEDALDTLQHTDSALKEKGITAIIVGSTRDCRSGKLTYGGWEMRKGLVTRTMVRVEPKADAPRECFTMNGNCVLIPREVIDRIGILDGNFTHSFGDFDYGFRACAAGVRLFMSAGYIGTCSENPIAGTWRDTSLPMAKRWKHLTSAKGSPLPDWFLYCRRHLGPAWPLYLVSPYVKTLVSGLFRRVYAAASL